MWESTCVGPRHGEHQVHGNAQNLSTVEVGEADRVGNDSLCHKRGVRSRVRHYARTPAAVQHLDNHRSLASNLAFTKGLYARD